MKEPTAWSNAILLAVISVAVAHAQAQRGPTVPQMRGDGPPPEAKPFSITRTDPALNDQVLSQNPNGGTEAPPKSTVTITVGKYTAPPPTTTTTTGTTSTVAQVP